MKLKYGLDDRPGAAGLLVFGLQWLAVVLPPIIILGSVLAGLHFEAPADRLVYLQKLTFFFSRALTGIWQSSLVLWMILGGSLASRLLFSAPGSILAGSEAAPFDLFFTSLNLQPHLEPGLLRCGRLPLVGNLQACYKSSLESRFQTFVPAALSGAGSSLPLASSASQAFAWL